jgi:manganese oxidase
MPVRGFGATNVKWSINGYIFGNMPLIKMKAGDRVRWYVATLRDFNNAHTPHWHGNTVIAAGQRTDVVSVLAAEMVTADMVPDTQAFGCTTATSAITCSRGWWRATR